MTPRAVAAFFVSCLRSLLTEPFDPMTLDALHHAFMPRFHQLRRSLAWLVAIVLLLGVGAVPAAAQSADSLIIRGKTLLHEGNNVADLDQIAEARSLFARAIEDDSRAALAHYYVARADDRLANYLMQQDEDRALDRINSAIDHLETATELEPEFADAYALLASMYGRKIALKPLVGMILGPKSDRVLDKAKELAPDNPRIVYITAVADYNKPSMWGGDKDRALKGLHRAVGLFAQETHDDPLAPSWGHEDAYAWLAIAYMDREAYSEARTALEEALEVNPDFGWVKTVLLPKLEQQQNS